MTKATTTSTPRPRRTKGEGTVYQEGDGFRAKLTLADGTVLRWRGRTRAEVRAKLDQARAAVTLGLPLGSTETLGPYLEWWLGVQEAKVGSGPGEMSPNTFDNYRWALGLASAVLGKYRLMDLEPEDVEKRLRRLAKAGMSRSSVIRVRTDLGKALDTAIRRGKVSRNAGRLAEMPRTEPPKEKQALTAVTGRSASRGGQGPPARGVDRGRPPDRPSSGRAPRPPVGERRSRRRHAGRDRVAKARRAKLRLGDVKRGIRRSRRRLSLPARAVEASGPTRSHRRRRGYWLAPTGRTTASVFASEVGTPMPSTNVNRRLARFDGGRRLRALVYDRARAAQRGLAAVGRGQAARGDRRHSRA